MIDFLNILKTCDFFRDFPDDVILEIVTSDICYKKIFAAGTTIYEMGHPITHAGIVLEGAVDVIHASANGHDTLINRFYPGTVFGASFSCTSNVNLCNDMRSYKNSVILFADIRRLLRMQFSHECFHQQLVDNILTSLAQSNIRLNSKVQVLSQKSLREKLLTYFRSLAEKNHSPEFELPFNREELANFLGSERSSVCRELSKLQDEQIITVTRNRIVLL